MDIVPGFTPGLFGIGKGKDGNAQPGGQLFHLRYIFYNRNIFTGNSTGCIGQGGSDGVVSLLELNSLTEGEGSSPLFYLTLGFINNIVKLRS